MEWICGFDGAAGGSDYDFVASARALHEAGIRTLLLVDEAQSIPRDTAQRLAELVNESGNAVQVILAGVDEPPLHAAVTAFPGAAEFVEIAGEITPQEVASWVHSTLDPDQLSRLKDLDWLELIRQTKGVPRLIRWELERRVATGDLATALNRKTVQAPRASAAPISESESGLVVAPAPALVPVHAAAGSTLLARPYATVGQLAAGFSRLAADRLRQLALWSRGKILTIPHRAREVAALLATALQHSRFAAEEMARSAAGLATAALEAIRGAVEQGGGRSSNLAEFRALLTRVVRRSRPVIEEIGHALAGFATGALAAVRGAADRGAERASNLLREKRSDFLWPRPGPEIAHTLRRVLDLPAAPLAFLAIVVALAFLLGRVTAPTREVAPRGPQIVSSGPPPAAQEASPRPPVPAPPAHPANIHRGTPVAPKHVLVTIEAHPRARIWIDGYAIGRTPLARVPLVPGRHIFQVAFSDGRRIHRTLEIRHGTHVVKFS